MDSSFWNRVVACSCTTPSSESTGCTIAGRHSSFCWSAEEWPIYGEPPAGDRAAQLLEVRVAVPHPDLQHLVLTVAPAVLRVDESLVVAALKLGLLVISLGCSIVGEPRNPSGPR